MVFKVVLVLAFIKYVLCFEAFLEPCRPDDLECVKVASDSLLRHTSAGIPKYGIQTLDPLELKYVEVADPGSDVVMHFKNIKVTGLKDLKMIDFKLDQKMSTKSVTLKFKGDSNIVADMTFEMKGPAKFLTGTYSAKATAVLTTAKFNIEFKPNAEGVEHIVMGPDIIICEAIEVPQVTFDPKLAYTFATDPDANARRAYYDKRSAEIKKRAVCYILAESFKVYMANLRIAMELMPKTQWLTGV